MLKKIKKEEIEENLINPGELPENASKFRHEAMATVFEVIIVNDDIQYAGQCAQAAFAEVDRLELELSRFNPNSDISKLNAAPRSEPIIVGYDTFECLKECGEITHDTGNAFDITVGNLLALWDNPNDKVNYSDGTDKDAEVAREDIIQKMLKYRDKEQVILIPESREIIKTSSGLTLDLGGYGKGYAVDRVVEILEEWDIENALIHGGFSSVYALGNLKKDYNKKINGWEVSLKNPGNPKKIITKTSINNQAVSGSGVKNGEHIINPRTGYPTTQRDGVIRKAAWAFTEKASVGDALSTAFMIMEIKEIKKFCRKHENVHAVVIEESADCIEEIFFSEGFIGSTQ